NSVPEKDPASTLTSSAPEQSLGAALVALQQRQRRIHNIKVTIVWLVLVAILIGGLLLIRFQPSYMLEHYNIILQGAGATLGVSLASIAIATVLALFGSIARLSSSAIAQGISGFYVSAVRGTPLLIQIFIIYLGLPQIGTQLIKFGYPSLGKLFIMDAIPAGILALSLNYGAYMTEIFRAGLQSIGYGQREAAIALGMTQWQVLRRIILPQAIRIIIPDVGNQFIAMQKDSALVSVMGVWEITYLATRYAKKDSKYMEMFILAAAAYWILTIVSSWFQSRIEKRMSRAYER
ncbi:MAG: amino acid ABC transporter permease, partial [Chloroflexota bacterium]|nr:amino acid ABC transporter permease [Anaerolineales bacterium]